MKTKILPQLRWAIILMASVMATSQPQRTTSQNLRSRDADWPLFSRDYAATRYSPLTQINANNVSRLKLAWRYQFRTEEERAKAQPDFLGGYSQLTPIVVNGIMYISAVTRIAALQGDTGKEIWSFRIPDGVASTRGVAYWPGDASIPARVFFTSGRKLIALSAATGETVNSFGDNGIVDMVVAYNSPPTMYKNLLIVGANVPEKPAEGP